MHCIARLSSYLDAYLKNLWPLVDCLDDSLASLGQTFQSRYDQVNTTMHHRAEEVAAEGDDRRP